MELFDEDLMVNEKTDNKKVTTIILVLIIFLIIMVLTVAGAMIYIKNTTLSVTLNGQESRAIKNMIKIDEENPQDVYVPIEQIAGLLNYSYFNGDYVTKSEETNHCYVECEDEVAMFSLNSNIIYKTLKDGNYDYEYFPINKDKTDAVKSFNDGKLYTTIDGIEKAFNVKWDYDIENNKMSIYTMPALIEGYSKAVTEQGYKKISEDFTNQKAILNGMIIVEKGEENTDKTCAVLDANSLKPILEAKYENIEYLEHTKDFLVTSNGKKGIISHARKTIVKMDYDEIKLMDYDKELYLVEKSNKYGILNFEGKNILDVEYKEIGIDNTNFSDNEIKSKYIIADTLIPVKKDELWGFFNTKGEQVTDFKYDSVGYITTNNKAGSGYNLLSVPDYNVIVVGNKDKYTVITLTGKEIWGLVFDSIYMYIDKGEISYLMEYNSKTYNLTEQLDGLGYGKNSKKENENEEEKQETSEDTTESEDNTDEEAYDETYEEDYSGNENYDENYDEEYNEEGEEYSEENYEEENYEE